MKKITLIILILFFVTAPTFADTLIIEPDDGREPILQFMQSAKSIDLILYGLTDPIFIDALTAAKKTGKNVRVLLEPLPYKNADENIKALQQLKEEKITLFNPNPHFQLTHQKTFIFDHKDALIMTFNLTRKTFKDERNFALLINDPASIKEIAAVFKADTQHEPIMQQQQNLIWSPENSRQKILTLINDAKKEIKIYAQSISDYQVIGALSKAAKRGVKVQILTEAYHPQQKKWNFLKKSGVDVCFNHPYMIHAKVMILDKKRVALGSINLTKPSIDKNRELSVISEDKRVIGGLLRVFNADWGC
jgi:phosphatidylserine/phosphatidylglycerophosphate/cardiolipin synthase-like enzyme